MHGKDRVVNLLSGRNWKRPHSKNYVNRSVVLQKMIKSNGSRVYLATLSYSHLGGIVMCDT